METTIEDVQDALATGRALREHGPYHVRIAIDSLEFHKAVVTHPVVTGRAILEAAGAVPLEEHVVLRVLRSGVTEEFRPDATMDLRSDGADRFVIFRTDRIFRFQLNEQIFDWGSSSISGDNIKRLAGVDLETHDLWQHVPENEDSLIEDKEVADLAAPGVERFFTNVVRLSIVVNAKRREVLSRHISYWEVVKLAFVEAVPSENIIYTVNYARGPRANPEGALVEGQRVKIKENMVFYVTPTDRS